jgi:L-asparagine oxygenase
VAEAGERVARHDIQSQAEAFVIEAQVQAAKLSSGLRRFLLEFRRFGHPGGGLLIRGIPIGPLPSTPDRADRRTGARSAAAAGLSVLAACLGDQYGFRPELGGSIVQDILPVRGFERKQISTSSIADLEAHTETAFSPYRPDYVALLCLRPDHEHQAGTTLSSIDAMLSLLDDHTIETLREPRFQTMVDPSFVIGEGLGHNICVDPIRVLEGPARRPRLRVDFAREMGTKGKDRGAQHALETLRRAAVETQAVVRLEAGEMLVLDNHYAVHGRTPFRPRYDGRDRWLLRSFITRDLGRSDNVRPGDERIVHPDYGGDKGEDLARHGHGLESLDHPLCT